MLIMANSYLIIMIYKPKIIGIYTTVSVPRLKINGLNIFPFNSTELYMMPTWILSKTCWCMPQPPSFVMLPPMNAHRFISAGSSRQHDMKQAWRALTTIFIIIEIASKSSAKYRISIATVMMNAPVNARLCTSTISMCGLAAWRLIAFIAILKYFIAKLLNNNDTSDMPC